MSTGLPSPSPSPGSVGLAGLESRDNAAISGLIQAGALSPREAADSPSLAGGLTCIGGAFATESRDSGSIAGRVETAILSRQESADFAALAGHFAVGVTVGLTEAGDAPAMHGDLPPASIAGVEGRDAGAMAGASASVATATATERGDAGSVVAAVHNSNTLAATEGRDAWVFSGSLATAGRLAATEGRDIVAIAAVTAVATTIAAAEARDRGAILSFALGIPPSFRVREAGDVATALGSSPTLRYNVYASPAPGESIDYSTPIAATAALSWTSGPIAPPAPGGSDAGPFPRAAFPDAAFPAVAYSGAGKVIVVMPAGPITLAVPGTWSFGVRAADANGEEENLDCSVTITLDAAGRDISNIPAPPVGLRAIPTAGAGITVLWAYPPASGPRAPTGFHVYLGSGGAPDYVTPAATVAFDAAIVGFWTAGLTGLIDGTTYAVGVRAFNGAGEEANITTVTATADGTGPSPVLNLTAVAVA